MRKFKNVKYIALLFILLLSLTLAGCSGDSAGSSEVAAKIDDVEISQNELNDVLVERYGAETLNSLISETIIELEVEKADIEVTEEEIDEEVEKMAVQYNGMEGLQAAMEQANLSEETLRDEIKTNLSLTKLLEPRMDITDEEIAEYYEENKDSFVQGEQVNASHILVEDEDEAKDIVKKLKDGEDFAELAKEVSKDEGTKEKGGELGFFGKGEMVPEFDEKAFEMEVDELSEPIKSDFGYHIILVHEKKDEEATSLEDSKDDIKDIIVEAKTPEVFNEWYSETIQEYDIENNLMEEPEPEVEE